MQWYSVHTPSVILPACCTGYQCLDFTFHFIIFVWTQHLVNVCLKFMILNIGHMLKHIAERRGTSDMKVWKRNGLWKLISSVARNGILGRCYTRTLRYWGGIKCFFRFFLSFFSSSCYQGVNFSCKHDINVIW